MMIRTQMLSLLTLISAVALVPGAVYADHELALANHAVTLRRQSQELHIGIERQFHASPYGPRMCRLATEIEEFACQIEEALLSGCTSHRARHLINVVDRRFTTLHRLFETAKHRADVGIDPRVGCTLALERKLQRVEETICCMQTEVRTYQPVSHRAHQPRRVDHGIQPPVQAPPVVHSQASIEAQIFDLIRLLEQSRRQNEIQHTADRYSGRPSFGIQRGSFRLSFGG